ncbi:hypothetical protein ACHQM5_022318 [Ranunculus cassubicifolius]
MEEYLPIPSSPTSQTLIPSSSSISPPSSSTSHLIPNLPDDIALTIIARVPHTLTSNLSHVCKSWRSILRSTDYFSIRSQLNCTQTFLYINLRIPASTFKWYSLDINCVNPKVLSPVPPIPVQGIGSAFAVLGCKIYVLGGSISDVPSRNVWVYDPRISVWEKGAKMRVAREFAAAGVIDEKIYVLGGCTIDNWTRSTNWAEVFDPKIGSWAPVPSPIEIREKWMHGSAVIGKQMYAMADRGGVAFSPGDSSWGHVSTEIDLGWRGRAAVVDEILYCYDYLGRIKGFDTKDFVWKELQGLGNELPRFLCGATMVNAGGKLCVVWEGQGKGRQISVCYAEIEVSKDSVGGLWGTVDWSQMIQEIPGASNIVHCLAVEF